MVPKMSIFKKTLFKMNNFENAVFELPGGKRMMLVKILV